MSNHKVFEKKKMSSSRQHTHTHKSKITRCTLCGVCVQTSSSRCKMADEEDVVCAICLEPAAAAAAAARFVCAQWNEMKEMLQCMMIHAHFVLTVDFLQSHQQRSSRRWSLAIDGSLWPQFPQSLCWRMAENAQHLPHVPCKPVESFCRARRVDQSSQRKRRHQPGFCSAPSAMVVSFFFFFGCICAVSVKGARWHSFLMMSTAPHGVQVVNRFFQKFVTDSFSTPRHIVTLNDFHADVISPSPGTDCGPDPSRCK